MADAHKTLWYTLRQIESDESRKLEEPSNEALCVTDLSDIKWLRNYFRDNAALLSPELHNAYHSALSTDIRVRAHYQSDFGEDMDLPGMISIAKKKSDMLEQWYKDLGGFDYQKQKVGK